MNLNMQLLWLATDTTRLTKSAVFAGICVQRPLDLNKAKRARQFQWSSISVSNTTNKLWVLTSHCSKLSRSVRIFTCHPSFACLSASLKK